MSIFNKSRLSVSSDQAGDTIVEVLIAVMVVGLAITLSYGVANRSLRASRQAQERGEALKLVEGQIESLKGLAVSDDNQGIFSKPTFCIDPEEPDMGKVTNHAAGFTNSSVADDDLSKYGNCSTGFYHLAINQNNESFTVTARWFGFGGTKKEELRAVYRLHP